MNLKHAAEGLIRIKIMQTKDTKKNLLSTLIVSLNKMQQG
jgi:hypothetical protein